MILSKLIYNTDVIGRRLLKNLTLATTDFLLAGLLTKKTLGNLQEIGLFNNRTLYFSKEELTNIEDFFNKNSRLINSETEPKCGVSLLGLDTRHNDAIRIYCRANVNSTNSKVAAQANRFIMNLKNRVLLKDEQRVENHFNKPGDPKFYLLIKKSLGAISKSAPYDKSSALTQLSRASYHLEYGITLLINESPEKSIIGLHPLSEMGELVTYSMGNAVLSEQLFKNIDQLFKGSQQTKSLLESRESMFSAIQSILKRLAEGKLASSPTQPSQNEFIKTLLDFSIANNQLNSTKKHQFLTKFADEFIQFIRQLMVTEGIITQTPIPYPGKLFQSIIDISKLKFQFELNRFPSMKGVDLCISHAQSPSLGKLAILFKEHPTDSEQVVMSFHLVQNDQSKQHTKSFIVKKENISDVDDVISIIKKQCASGVIHSTPIASMLKAMRGWLV